MSAMPKIAALCLILTALSGCQFFVDGRDEALMVVSAQEWAEVSHKAMLHEEAARMKAAPTAIPGSEMISFTSQTDAYLSGCSSLGIVEVHHYGSEEEAMTLLRNEAMKLAATAIVPLDFYQDKSQPADGSMQSGAQKLSFMKGRMVRCPDMPQKNGA